MIVKNKKESQSMNYFIRQMIYVFKSLVTVICSSSVGMGQHSYTLSG